MISAWICATAAKSRPKQGLAATRISTSPPSSRASTVRCTLPPDNSPIAVASQRIFVELRAMEPPAAGLERRTVELAEGEIVGDAHPRHAGILQRLLGKHRE